MLINELLLDKRIKIKSIYIYIKKKLIDKKKEFAI